MDKLVSKYWVSFVSLNFGALMVLLFAAGIYNHYAKELAGIRSYSTSAIPATREISFPVNGTLYFTDKKSGDVMLYMNEKTIHFYKRYCEEPRTHNVHQEWITEVKIK